MEKKLTQRDLFRNLLRAAVDPFSSLEKVQDIETIFKTSNAFEGMNHLTLAKSYLEPGLFPFHIDRDEAIQQAKLAIQEKNYIGYYYLYRLSTTESEKRKYLRLSVFYSYPVAYLEYARLVHDGIYFTKNIEEAYHYYALAAQKKRNEGYDGMIRIDIERGDYEQEKKDIQLAKQNGYSVMGYIE